MDNRLPEEPDAGSQRSDEPTPSHRYRCLKICFRPRTDVSSGCLERAVFIFSLCTFHEATIQLLNLGLDLGFFLTDGKIPQTNPVLFTLSYPRIHPGANACSAVVTFGR